LFFKKNRFFFVENNHKQTELLVNWNCGIHCFVTIMICLVTCSQDETVDKGSEVAKQVDHTKVSTSLHMPLVNATNEMIWENINGIRSLFLSMYNLRMLMLNLAAEGQPI